MLVSQLYPRRYATGEDLKGTTPTKAIRTVVMEKVGPVMKPVIYFQGQPRGVILNATLANDIKAILGDNTDGWINMPVTLWSKSIMINSIVRWPMRATNAAAAAPATPPPAPLRPAHFDPDLNTLVYTQETP
jgi:hypothetical protein